MAFTLPKASSFGGNVDDGRYPARFVGYSDPKQGRYGMTINLNFRIDGDEDYDGAELSQLYGVDSKKFYNAVAAIQGGEYDEAAELEDAVGNAVTITVENIEKGENTYSNVVGVKPRKASRPKRPAKPVVVEDDADPFDDDEEL